MSKSITNILQILEGVDIPPSKIVALKKALKRQEKELVRKDFIIKRLEVDQKVFKRFLHETIVKLEHKNKELERYIESNLQLENFAHIASHDLKAPLNNILSFSTLLQSTAADKLNPAEVNFLQFIIKGAGNMQSTIRALLKFSQATNSKLQTTAFSPQELLQELLSDITNTISHTNTTISMVNLPSSIVGDPVLLKEVFQNLILNGIKFVAKDILPIIEIGGEEKNDTWQFSVQDNGIGIAPEFQEKVFAMLQRLNSKEVYEGTGMGLAICKKIIEQHGGTIWVESQPDKGSTFYFSIPKVSNTPSIEEFQAATPSISF